METNQTFDRFASRGSLPKKLYDFYCPQMGGDPKRENYLKSSCIDRQKQNTCDDKNCKHRQAQYEKPQRRRRKSHKPNQQTETPMPQNAIKFQMRTTQRKDKMETKSDPVSVKKKGVSSPFSPKDVLDHGGIVVPVVFQDSARETYTTLLATARTNGRTIEEEILTRLTKGDL